MKFLGMCAVLAVGSLVFGGQTPGTNQNDSGVAVIGVSAAGVRNRGQENFGSPTFSIALKNDSPKTVTAIDWDVIVVRRLDQGGSQWYQLKSKAG